MEWRELEAVLKEYPEVVEGAKQPGNGLRLVNLLADYFPTEQRSIRLLKLALDINILHELNVNPIDLPLVRRLSRRLTDEFFLQEDMAGWAVDMWLHAYGAGVLGKAVPSMEEKWEETPASKPAAQSITVDFLLKQQLEDEKRRSEEKRLLEEKRMQQEEEKRTHCHQLAKKRQELNATGFAFDGRRDFKVILKRDGVSKETTTYYWGNYPWEDINIVAVATGIVHTVGLKSDGTVVAVGDNNSGQCNVSAWKDIVAIAANWFNTIGLKSDGTVVVTGVNEAGSHNVSNWKDIIAIVASCDKTVGLKSDGTVVATDAKCDVSNWRGIVAIVMEGDFVVGLKSDGTVVAAGDNEFGQCNVSAWRDIVTIAVSWRHTVGLKSNGTVVATGVNEEGQCNVSAWRDIVAIAARYNYTAGIKLDGTVVAVGSNEVGQCDVSDWRDIIAIAMDGDCYTVGLTSDGTILATDQEGYKHAEERRKSRRRKNLCQHCGGEFKGLLIKKCASCGKPKDY